VHFAWAVSVYFYTIVSNHNGALAVDVANIGNARHITTSRSYLDAQTDSHHYEAVAWWLHVQVAWAVSVYFYTIVSNYNDALALDFVLINDATHKKRVLTSELDPVMIEYRNNMQATDVKPEVEVYMSSTRMYRRGLSTNTSYITYVSHNYKLQMCPGEAFIDMAVTE
jgi:hypothetical protein